MSEMQSNIEIGDANVYGTLHYVDTESDLVTAWGPGNFIAVNLINNDFDEYSSVKIGVRPTYKSGSPVDDDSGLVEIKTDPDKNGVFKVNNVATQKLRIVATTTGGEEIEQNYALATLVVENH